MFFDVEFKIKSSEISEHRFYGEYFIFTTLLILLDEDIDGKYTYSVVAESSERCHFLKTFKSPKAAFNFVKKVQEKYPYKRNFIGHQELIEEYKGV